MKSFSASARLKSFTYAFRGLLFLFKHEHNAWLHGIAAVTSIVLGFILNIVAYEWLAIILAIGMVLTAELFNTAIEKIADFIHPEKHKSIATIKDLAAGGVLISAITAFAVGLIVFLPKIIAILSK